MADEIWGMEMSLTFLSLKVQFNFLVNSPYWKDVSKNMSVNFHCIE